MSIDYQDRDDMAAIVMPPQEGEGYLAIIFIYKRIIVGCPKCSNEYRDGGCGLIIEIEENEERIAYWICQPKNEVYKCMCCRKKIRGNESGLYMTQVFNTKDDAGIWLQPHLEPLLKGKIDRKSFLKHFRLSRVDWDKVESRKLN